MRNVTMKDWGFLAHSRLLLHDHDGKFCPGVMSENLLETFRAYRSPPQLGLTQRYIAKNRLLTLA